MASVSVVIPTYNGTRFIREALESVFAQTLPPQEIIVVDDCSTDGTVELVSTVAVNCLVPTRVIRLERNSGGPARPVNVGVASTDAGFIAICEQDDTFYPAKLASISGLLRSHPRVAMAISRYHVDRGAGAERIGVNDEFSAFETLPRRPLGPGHFEFAREAYDCGIGRNFAASLSNMVFRRDRFLASGGLDESLQRACDHDMLLRFLRSETVGLVDEALWRFRRHGECATLTSSGHIWLNDYEQIFLRELRAARPRALRAKISDRLRMTMLGRAYGQRNEGQYWQAACSYSKSILHTGPSAEAVLGLAKLAPHYLVRRRHHA